MALCGSRFYSGAAALAAMGALRSGVGLCCLATTDRVAASLTGALPECTFFPLGETEEGTVCADQCAALLDRVNRSSACLMGCGLGQSSNVEMLVNVLLAGAKCQLILDADALNTIAPSPQLITGALRPPIITPHVGEMSRLCGLDIAAIKADRAWCALDFASRWNCVVVLKDYQTVVASPDGRLWRNTTGNAGLARGGSGDLLAGIISSFAAQGIDPVEAAVCGVYLHGLAADRCAKRLSQYGMLPGDLPAELCAIFTERGL